MNERNDRARHINTRAAEINAKIDDGTVTREDLDALSDLARELRDLLRGEPRSEQP